MGAKRKGVRARRTCSIDSELRAMVALNQNVMRRSLNTGSEPKQNEKSSTVAALIPSVAPSRKAVDDEENDGQPIRSEKYSAAVSNTRPRPAVPSQTSSIDDERYREIPTDSTPHSKDNMDNCAPSHATSTPVRCKPPPLHQEWSPIPHSNRKKDFKDKTYGLFNLCEESTIDGNDIRLFDCMPNCGLSLDDEEIKKILE